MAIIPQRSLFSWREIEELGDLERLGLVLEHLPDEPLMRTLESERGRGRDDYPIRAVWNSFLAMVVYQHPSVESLRRELSRNGQLRDLCGFDPVRTAAAVPPAWVYTRFFRRLGAHADEVQALFDRLVEGLKDALPSFGRTLAIDGKAIETHARPRQKGSRAPRPDGRRDVDADFGAKSGFKQQRDGTWIKRVRPWFGYKLHLVVDADHELPVAFDVTRASVAEQPVAHRLVGEMAARHRDLLDGAEHLVADKGYDDGKLLSRLFDNHQIKPVIAKRDDWSRDDDETRLLPGTRNVVYDNQGNVYCYCPQSGARYTMAYGGFEKDRRTLKYRCPARHYGFPCPGMARCEVKSAVRIPLSEDRRIFTPVARSAYKWQRLYNQRGAVERVNSRLDVSYGFERHFIRGLAKMRLRVGLALSVMLAMALGRVRENRPEKLRSLVRAA